MNRKCLCLGKGSGLEQPKGSPSPDHRVSQGTEMVSREQALRPGPCRKCFVRSWSTSAPEQGSSELLTSRVYVFWTFHSLDRKAGCLGVTLMRTEFPGTGHPCAESRWQTFYPMRVPQQRKTCIYLFLTEDYTTFSHQLFKLEAGNITSFQMIEQNKRILCIMDNYGAETQGEGKGKNREERVSWRREKQKRGTQIFHGCSGMGQAASHASSSPLRVKDEKAYSAEGLRGS